MSENSSKIFPEIPSEIILEIPTGIAQRHGSVPFMNSSRKKLEALEFLEKSLEEFLQEFMVEKWR